MPHRDLQGYLWDVIDNCKTIEQFTQNKTQNDYENDTMLRLACERSLSIIGEALAQARQHFPNELNTISDLHQIIGFRNKLIHAYLNIDDDTVWSIIQSYLPKLKQEAQTKLDRLEQEQKE